MLRDAYQLLATQIHEKEIVEQQKDKASNVRPSPAAQPAAKVYYVNTPPADTPAASTYDPANDPRAHQTMKYLPHKKTWVSKTA